MFLSLTGLNQAARGAASQSLCEVQEEQKALCPFDKLATKLGLPTNCDIDLRRQDELEVTGVNVCAHILALRGLFLELSLSSGSLW